MVCCVVGLIGSVVLCCVVVPVGSVVLCCVVGPVGSVVLCSVVVLALLAVDLVILAARDCTVPHNNRSETAKHFLVHTDHMIDD